MKPIVYFTLITFLCLGLSNCSSQQNTNASNSSYQPADENWEIVGSCTNQKPLWVYDLDEYRNTNYSRGQIYKSSGEGVSLEEARSKARTDIVRSFGVPYNQLGRIIIDEYWEEWRVRGRTSGELDRTVFRCHFLVDSDAENNAAPQWITNKPSSPETYYFIGWGEEDDQAVARNMAISDAMAQIVYAINVSISANTNFNSVYQGTNTTGIRSTRMSKSIDMAGTQEVSGINIEQQHFTQGDEMRHKCYVLISIPQSEIEAAIEKVKQLRRELENSPTLILAYSIDLNGNIQSMDDLKVYLEQFYQMQGYPVVQQFFSLNNLQGSDINGHISQILQSRINAKRVVIAAIKAGELQHGLMGSSFMSIRGTCSIREIDTETNMIINSQNFEGKGLSSRSEHDAFLALVNNFAEMLFETQE